MPRHTASLAASLDSKKETHINAGDDVSRSVPIIMLTLRLVSHVRRGVRAREPRAQGRGLHSSTFQLNLSRF
jgi:hypothetical protein